MSKSSTELHEAAVKRNIDAVRHLTETQPDLVHSRDEKQRTPLQLAARGGCLEVVELLIKAGADVNTTDEKYQTPLQMAAYYGFKEVAMGYQDYGEHVQLFTNYTGLADAVAKDPNGIGYAGIDPAQHAGAKAVSVDGVAPSAANVNGKRYPYARALRFYTDAVNEPAKAKDFISFVLSPAGQQVLTQMGYAPKP